ncbi:peptidoglycan-binding domain-containing protein [Stackebrandtia nassauensis]|uniref:Peptidoglycan-binding domain 1 protein n=1 Tax=Stackebrandtia nassauensis (strain DSM 44728 / CIP 108903 / NRRL B-16338 / NBRC 102104 / LLR-40K-21) TaxID=446470 RepID=D3PXG0_STANL|nr:peptidoglycan-binding protein [Stackebrandtia nassauensis]ADD41423.1 Peptidoglycan-binding domain 1 protein [Stackebrandtia nassauensis DSM 44728]
MRNRKRKIAMGVGAAALVVGGVAGVAGIASADPGTKAVEYVDGFGNVNDDFNDHQREAGVLCDGCENSSDTDLVTLWQSILASDGYLGLDEIDGDFGAATADATAAWQGDNELDPTGEVDQATWATADDYLELGDNGYDVFYPGDEQGGVNLERDPDDGTYDLLDVTDPAGATYANASGEGYIWIFEESIKLTAAE